MLGRQIKFISPRVIKGNRGDLLSRWGILTAISSMTSGPITVFCSQRRHLPPIPAKPLHYGAVYNFFPSLRGWRALAKADVVLWTGGLDLQDDSSLAKLCHTWLTFFVYRLLGLKIVCVCQGAGPLTSMVGRLLTRMVLNQVLVFMARDLSSFNLIASLNSRTKLVRSHDGIFFPGFEMIEASERKMHDCLKHLAEGPHGPLIAINMRLWFHFAGGFLPYQFAKRSFRKRAEAKMNAFTGAFVKLMTRLRLELDARIVLISMYEPGAEEWEDDAVWLRRLKKHFINDPAVILCDDDLTIPEFVTLMRCFDLVIGTRLHSTLAALRQGVRAIHLSYTLKGQDIFEGLGLKEFAVDLDRFIDVPDDVFTLAQATIGQKHLPAKIVDITRSAIADNVVALRRTLDICTGTPNSRNVRPSSNSQSS